MIFFFFDVSFTTFLRFLYKKVLVLILNVLG